MFRFIAWAAHCLPTQQAYFDPCVIEVMQQEMKIQPAILNNVVELKAPSYESITREAA